MKFTKEERIKILDKERFDEIDSKEYCMDRINGRKRGVDR